MFSRISVALSIRSTVVHSQTPWKLKPPVPRLGQGRPFQLRTAPSVPPRTGISSMSRKNVETVYDAVSVEGLLHRTRKLVETNCPKNVELCEENALTGECVLGNATQLQQVLLNISINAIHAIGPEGGTLTIRGSVVPRRELEALFPEEKISEEWQT